MPAFLTDAFSGDSGGRLIWPIAGTGVEHDARRVGLPYVFAEFAILRIHSTVISDSEFIVI